MPTRRNPKSGTQSPQITTLPPAGSPLGGGDFGSKKPKGERKGFNVRVANREIMITRRHLLFGAAGVGAVAALAVGSKALSGGGSSGGDVDIEAVSVDANRVFSQENCTVVDAEYLVSQVGEYDLPYGTLIWIDDDSVGACLLPTETASPLTLMALLFLDSGEYVTVRDNAVGAEEGFEIYDVRATSAGLIWTEANIFEERWRIYCAPMKDGMVGEPSLLEEGGREVETPSIIAAGDYCFWQLMPQAESEDARRGAAFIKRAKFNAAQAETVFEAKGRFATPLYACDDALVFTPRHEESSYYFQLKHMDASSKKIDASITLPESMKPNQVGYGPNGFAICFDSIYDYENGLSNLGTYTPTEAPAGGETSSYSDLDWFRFGRTPYASPAWCGQDLFIVKSTQSVCAVDMVNRCYCALDIEDGCNDWGDYLVSSGARSTFATSMQIDYTTSTGEETHTTRVRIWAAVPAEERLSVEEIEAIRAQEEAQAEAEEKLAEEGYVEDAFDFGTDASISNDASDLVST